MRSQPQAAGNDSHPAQSPGRDHGSDSARRPSRMMGNNGIPRKPKALAAGSRLGVFAPASAADSVEMIAGLAELKRHGFQVVANQDSKAEGYFAGQPLERVNSFLGNVNSTGWLPCAGATGRITCWTSSWRRASRIRNASLDSAT